jgi:2-phosphosulfolactate phosphatase
MIEIRRTTLSTCHGAGGIVVVIDVLRAFTTAAFAFERGATEIVLVATVDEAFALRERFPESLLIGEVGGLPIDGFDLPNSPTAVAGADLDGRRLILRTSSGTQGVVRVRRAERLLGASLANAAATAQYIRRLAPAAVTFVETGIRDTGGGEEDTACADLIAGLVIGTSPALAHVQRRVRESRWAARFADPAQPEFPESDLAHCLEVDRFTSAMLVHREDGLLVLRPNA